MLKPGVAAAASEGMPCLLKRWLSGPGQQAWYSEYHTQELHPMAFLYQWEDNNVATPLYS